MTQATPTGSGRDHQQWLAELGRLASHLAHEVRSQLLSATLHLHRLQRHVQADRAAGDITQQIESALVAVDSVIQDLAHFTAQREPKRQTLSAPQLVSETLEAVEPQLLAQHIRVEVDVPAAQQVYGDRQMLRRMLLNLVQNALDAMPQGGELVITGHQGRQFFELEVADSGPGLFPLETHALSMSSAFSQLRTAVVEQVAQLHHGSLFALNCPEGGAAWTLRLPAVAVSTGGLRKAA